MFVLIRVLKESFASYDLLVHIVLLVAFLKLHFTKHLLDLTLLFEMLYLFLKNLVILALNGLTIRLKEVPLTLTSYFHSSLSFSFIIHYIFELLLELRLYHFRNTRNQPFIELAIFLIGY